MGMMLNLLTVVVMGGLFLYMMRKSVLASTRQLAFVPLGVCAMEIFAAGLLHPVSFPILTALLIALRLAIAGCCVLAIRRDAAYARRRARKNNAARAQLRRELLRALPARVPDQEDSCCA